MSTELSGVVAENIQAINLHDLDAFMATFATDAYVNDNRRQINGTRAILRWAEKEIFGDNVTVDPVEVTDHYGETIITGRWDGTYDKTNIPDELIMASYYGVDDGKIVSLTIINNQASDY
ncbi:MAG: hypothetical protein JWP75_2560 [Frondihabitans sp.]|nr:hypothetical protein [Frondihabitans sp.]